MTDQRYARNDEIREGVDDAIQRRQNQSEAGLEDRDGGLGVGRRLALCAAAGAGVCLAASSLAEGSAWWLWLSWPVMTLVGAGLLRSLEPRSARQRQPPWPCRCSSPRGPV